MIAATVIAAVAIMGIAATIRALLTDGHRRVPTIGS